MGSHLSKLEEPKIKKLVHVEINEEEEKEEWDERDKADYDRNKQLEKLTVDAMAMKEKIKKMQLAFHKAQGMDDYLYKMGGLSSKVSIALLPKFKISNAETFDGIGDPKQTLHAFPLSLTGGASMWYCSLDPSRIKVWNELVELLVGETFTEYMTRWKGKSSKMANRPNKKNQINMITKNLLPTYNSKLLSSPISSFGELCDYGTRIEDAINNEQLEKWENKPSIKKTYWGGTFTSKAPNPMNVSAIIPQPPLAYQIFTKKAHQEFSDLGMTFAQAYENLTFKGFLKPLDPTPMPNIIPPTWKLNEYYHFHQKSSYKTDNYFFLKYEIQDLINNGTLLNSNIITKPNIRKNPLPNYHRDPPLYLNYVEVEEIDWVCSKLLEVMEVNMMEIQGIWDEEDENLKSAIAMWGIVPKGMFELKKRI